MQSPQERRVAQDEGSNTFQDASRPSEVPAIEDQKTQMPRQMLAPSKLTSTPEGTEKVASCSNRASPDPATDNRNPSQTICKQQTERGERYMYQFGSHVPHWETYSTLNACDFDLRPLFSADREPPITKASLGSLDISNIIKRPRMRHDLNFDRDMSEVEFRPSYMGAAGQRKKERSDAYWQAMSIELALYMECAIRPNSECLLHAEGIPNHVWRLPTLFNTLRDILPTLIRDEDWPSVDQALDVDLLMQQLRKGVCDLVLVNNWLGRILKGSCSPLRDKDVDTIVETMNEAVAKFRPVQLSRGLLNLFSLFEIMKLVSLTTKRYLRRIDCSQDIANHQLRFLRLLMINDSTDYVRERFLQRMLEDVDDEPALDRDELQEARIWYDRETLRVSQEQCGDDEDDVEEENVGIERCRITLLGRAIRDLVRDPVRSGGCEKIPVSFGYDRARIHNLQRNYRQMLSDRQIWHVFLGALRNRGFSGDLSMGVKEMLRFRILQLAEPGHWPGENLLPAKALEIVRTVYEICGIKEIPSAEDTMRACSCLAETKNPDSEVFGRIEEDLSNDLDDYIEYEIGVIYSLPPLQIHEHCHPEHLMPAQMQRPPELLRLEAMGMSIAQITVLNWRIWAPILYHTLQENLFVAGEEVQSKRTPVTSSAD